MVESERHAMLVKMIDDEIARRSDDIVEMMRFSDVVNGFGNYENGIEIRRTVEEYVNSFIEEVFCDVKLTFCEKYMLVKELLKRLAIAGGCNV